MPFKLHPSGYLSSFTISENSNLRPKEVCPLCLMLCGHKPDCELYKGKLGGSSRSKLYNSSSVLWAMGTQKSFITFTLPSKVGRGYYQDSPQQDLEISAAFSRTLEAFAVKIKRERKQKLSYVWVAESQTKRKLKYGGIGDLHFHLIASVRIKSDPTKHSPRGMVIDQPLLNWLQENWTKQIGVSAKNCVDVEPIPDYINSMPAYMAKYLGKGAQRDIHSRQYAATRDLTKFKPITLHELPEDVDLMAVNEYTTQEGYTVVTRYYHTGQALEQYGHLMAAKKVKETKPEQDPNFSPMAISARELKRLQKVSSKYQL